MHIHLSVFICVHASVHVPMYEYTQKPKTDAGCLPAPGFMIEAESLAESRRQFEMEA